MNIATNMEAEMNVVIVMRLKKLSTNSSDPLPLRTTLWPYLIPYYNGTYVIYFKCRCKEIMISILLAAMVWTNAFSCSTTNLLLVVPRKSCGEWSYEVPRDDLMLKAASPTILEWKDDENKIPNLTSIAVTEAGTNLVIHTQLVPVVTKTNDTYYIEFKSKRDSIVIHINELDLSQYKFTNQDYFTGSDGKRYSLKD